MMAKGVVAGSIAVTGRPHIPAMALSSSSVAPHQGRTSYGASLPPVAAFRISQLRMRFTTLSPRRLANSNSGWRTFSSSELRNLAVCCATYGSTNGNGRPGSGVEKPGDGYNSGLLTGNPEISEGRSPENLKIEKRSEIPAKRREETFGLSSGDALHKYPSERQGDDPYRVLENGQKVYLDELDVITLLEPPPFLRPLQSVYYNHAAFLWKKIGDIPEVRRHRLLDLLLPRHITKMWELSKLRYEDPDAFAETAADMLPRPDMADQGIPRVWDGRVIQGGKFLRNFSDRVAPLFFEVMHADSVMETEEPCDIVFEYGDGHLHLCNSIPPGFAKPVKHLPPFNDKACDYLRAVGPGVMVGQSWVEGRKLEQLPRRLFGEFIMVQKFQ